MNSPLAGVFQAYASVLANLVVVACFLPFIVLMGEVAILHPASAGWERVLGLLMISPFLVYYGVALRLCTMSGPVIDINEHGLLWRRWSNTRIPWSAVARWSARSTLGQHYVTLWLHDRAAYPCTTINALLSMGKRRLGYGDITLATGGTDGRQEELKAAIQANLHIPPGGRVRP